MHEISIVKFEVFVDGEKIVEVESAGQLGLALAELKGKLIHSQQGAENGEHNS